MYTWYEMSETAQPTTHASQELPRVLLELAREVEEAEQRIKHAILEAARGGDPEIIIVIVKRWLTEPPCEVAKSLPQRDQPDS